MSVWVLFVIAFLTGGPKTDSAVYTTRAACEAAQAKSIEVLVSHNVSVGSVTCSEAKIGEFS